MQKPSGASSGATLAEHICEIEEDGKARGMPAFWQTLFAFDLVEKRAL